MRLDIHGVRPGTFGKNERNLQCTRMGGNGGGSGSGGVEAVWIGCCLVLVVGRGTETVKTTRAVAAVSKVVAVFESVGGTGGCCVEENFKGYLGGIGGNGSHDLQGSVVRGVGVTGCEDFKRWGGIGGWIQVTTEVWMTHAWMRSAVVTRISARDL